MKFYIVTPSYRAISWLPRCVRSVADQVGNGVEVHHHVQDGGSDDGSAEWLDAWQKEHADAPGYTFSYECKGDAGMYDAINKSWDLLPDDADVTAHLNADEQYLPGALAEVAAWCLKKPGADVLLGVYIISDETNQYICHRCPVVPRLWSSRLNCTCITNSSFYRASSFRRFSPRFDTRWKCIGDLLFFRELLALGVRFDTMPIFTSLFVCTGENLAWTDQASKEWKELCSLETRWYLLANHLIYRWVNFKRRVVAMGIKAPPVYEVYVSDSPERMKYAITHPTVIWKRKT